MQNRNISDIIERYLKSILAEASQVEIKRSEVADQFGLRTFADQLRDQDAFYFAKWLFSRE